MKSYGERCVEYDNYLRTHIGNVKRCWEEFLRPAVIGEVSPGIIQQTDAMIAEHDASKIEPCEYDAYLDYFYPADGETTDDKEFDVAWNHHQKRNPHHWQYWVLIKDSGDVIPQDMPLPYLFEMLCDWGSFPLANPGTTTKDWYNKNKSHMMLSEKTRELVETYIEYIC